MSNPQPEKCRPAEDPQKKERLSFLWIFDGGETELETTLAHYLDELEQDFPESQLVVMNNGAGEDATRRALTQLRGRRIGSTVLTSNGTRTDSAALSAAFQHATGSIIILLPSYIQSDPRCIGAMLEAVAGGLDYVASRRIHRVDTRADQRKSEMFNAATRWVSGTTVHDINSGLRVMRREVIEDLPLRGDLHIFLPILAARYGFSVGEVPVRHVKDRPSRPGHGFSGYLRRALDLLTLFFLLRFTEKPFRFFGGLGTGLLAAGGLINLVLVVERLVLRHALADRPMLIFATLLVVLGIQMFSLGLIGELIIFVNAGGSPTQRVENAIAVSGETSDPAAR